MPNNIKLLFKISRPEFLPANSASLFIGVAWGLTLPLDLLWGLAIPIVNPIGEFMINDDWAFTRSLESLIFEGRLASTGWGPDPSRAGGPSLIVHLLWGALFSQFLGFSLTTLRISVLAAGVLGSFGMLALLRSAGLRPWVGLLGALTLAASPLYFSQSFTFMTDITFTCFLIFALLFLQLGVTRLSLPLVALGLFFSLLATLTRQIGLVIPLGFLAASWLLPEGRALGRANLAALTASIAIIPWIGYEAFLAWVGSTPVTQHQVIHNIHRHVLEKGLWDYLVFLYTQVFHYALTYVAFSVSPLLVLYGRHLLAMRGFRLFALSLTAVWISLEAGILLGLIDPPVLLYRNVIVDLGIGPVLLKDVYILDIRRLPAMPKPIYYLCLYWAILCAVALLVLVFQSLRRLCQREKESSSSDSASFLAAFSLLSTLAYVAIIALTGFHDRYLIPVCALLAVWLASEAKIKTSSVSLSESPLPPFSQSPRSYAFGAIALTLVTIFGVFSVTATHDFMALKRALNKAHNYLLHELKVDPCQVDGGFEFNGYHCYRPDFKAREGLSWWWVAEERFVITLGPLTGYRLVRTYPFERYLAGDGEIHILEKTEAIPPKNPSR